MSFIIVTGSLFAVFITITTVGLASRINRSQPIIEAHEAMWTSRTDKKFVPRRYPVEINA